MSAGMTLKEWREDSSEVLPYYGNHGSVAIPETGRTEEKRAQLWNLTDYRVVGVVGGSIWMLEKPIHLVEKSK
jgi:hypothetical protein